MQRETYSIKLKSRSNHVRVLNSNSIGMTAFIFIFLSAFLLACVAGSHLKSTEEHTPLSNGHLSTSLKKALYPDSRCNADLACSENHACPTGLFCHKRHCKCGVYPYNIIECNGTSSFVLRRYCVTFDEQRNLTLVGNCIRTIKNKKSIKGLINGIDNLYHLLPRNVHELNDSMCNSTNRTGTLCGRCLPDHYPLAYSYNVTCILCPHARWNWFRYIMAAYLPLTLFYGIILFFKVNITSSHLFAVIYYCQSVSPPLLVRIMLSVVVQQANPSFYTAFKLCASLYGIWNLDFFRPFYSDLCLGIGILPTLALDYVIAVYPLLLISVSYILIDLHDRNFRVITLIWKPFQKLFSLFRRNWDIKTSVVDAFATFFFLSNVRFLSVSYDLLVPTKIYQLYPHRYNYTLGLYYAAHISFLGREHLPYALLAFLVMFIFVILPVLTLALYPFGLFQRFLNFIPIRWYVLHAFVGPFYRCYKDGTEPGTRDYRWFASVFFGIRIFQFLLYSLSDFMISLAVAVVGLILQATLVVVLQPFNTHGVDYNAVNVVFLQLATLFANTAVTINFSTYLAPQFVFLFYVFRIIIAVFPFLYALGSTLLWLYAHKKSGVSIMHRIRTWRAGYTQLRDDLPDRIEHSSEYHRENLSSFVSHLDENSSSTKN